MKNIIIAIVLMFSVSITAQRQVEKSMTVSSGQDIFLNFKFAENIKIEQWNKNEVLAKVSVNIDDGEGDEFFSLETETIGETVEMRSEFGDYFENKNRKDRNYWNRNTTTDIIYTVYVPMNANLKIKSISGDVESNSFKGNLKTDLVAGDVTIKSYDGELWLKTVSGDLDVTMENADINVKTLTGTIYSNIDMDKSADGKKSSGHNKIQTKINKGGKLVKMETVSGDIFLRKS
jgi:hypothetical protein